MIPKIIHRIWVDGSPPAPEEFIMNGQRWRELHPEWDVKLWGRPSLKMLNSCLYDNPITHDVHRFRADLLRLELLYQYGGLYVDMDIEPMKPVDDLVSSIGTTAAVAYSPNRWKGKHVLSNAFIAAEPRNPWIARCIKLMRVSVKQFSGSFLAMVTGPHHLDRCLRTGDNVTILDTSLVYPTDMKQLARAYTFHSWANKSKLKKEALV